MIKRLQQTEMLEGKKTDEANIMNAIIKEKEYSGKQLIICNTRDSFMKLFKNKIKPKTARILEEHLSMERQMFMRREQSKRHIKNGKWKPHVGEKIRLVEVKYKPPYRSYSATIKKVLQTQVYVCYDGYDDKHGESGEWVKRDQWPAKITILETLQANKPAPGPPNRTQPQINAMNNQNDSNRNLPKRKSVPPNIK
eukprot:518122_1